jgi:hypothetical protein
LGKPPRPTVFRHEYQQGMGLNEWEHPYKENIFLLHRMACHWTPRHTEQSRHHIFTLPGNGGIQGIFINGQTIQLTRTSHPI